MPQSAIMTVGFCQRWLNKAARYDDRTLDGAFDKFFSLFVAFNRLYSHISATSGRVVKGDRRQATEAFASIIGTDRLLEALLRNGGEVDLRTMRELIRPGGRFYLISDGTTDQPNVIRNEDLYRRLDDRSDSIKVRAALEYVYLVRCNMFHGSKDFDRAQLEIIQPATRCLARIIEAGLRIVDPTSVQPGTSVTK